MSSFLVSNKSINRIAQLIREVAPYHRQLYGHLGNGIDAAFWNMAEGDCVTEEEMALVGQAVYNMNIRALRARYGDRPAFHDLSAQPYQYRPESLVYLSRVAIIKMLDCYLYQCAEGDVPEEYLFKALETVRARLCRLIVMALQEYTDADWE